MGKKLFQMFDKPKKRRTYVYVLGSRYQLRRDKAGRRYIALGRGTMAETRHYVKKGHIILPSGARLAVRSARTFRKYR